MATHMAWPALLSGRRYRAAAGPAAASRPTGEDIRSPFQKDADRIIYAAPFRRLQDKTQVHATTSSDYVRTRLTHSLEVSSVGRSLGRAVGERLAGRGALDGSPAGPSDLAEIAAAACLAHDIGNPPFGHAGEDAIRKWFEDRRGALLEGQLDDRQIADLTRFDGNAEGFRIITRLTGSREQGGLELTAATLGAILKYPHDAISGRGGEGKFCAFDADLPALRWVAEETGLRRLHDSRFHWARHPLNTLVEAADDICYLVVDLEDGCKLGDLPFEEAESLLRTVAGSALSRYGGIDAAEDRLAYLRAKAIGELCRQCVAAFARHENDILEGAFTDNLLDRIDAAEHIGVLRRYCAEKLFVTRAKAEAELAGARALHGLLDIFVAAILAYEGTGWQFTEVAPGDRRALTLLPRELLKHAPLAGRYGWLLRAVDYVAGMTDRFALSLYRRLGGWE